LKSSDIWLPVTGYWPPEMKNSVNRLPLAVNRRTAKGNRQPEMENAYLKMINSGNQKPVTGDR
jgi:hypothetical protein